jgi:HK97 family phage prohead protease
MPIKGYITQLEVKDIDAHGTLIQAFTRYDILDSDNERGRKGMFTKTWQENFPRIRHLLNHNSSQPLGENQKFWEDNEYAYAQSKIGTHNLGQDFIKMVDSGLIKEASYGYNTVKSNKLKDGSTELLEVKLWEWSSLTSWGANEFTPIISLQKGMNLDPVKDLLERYTLMKSFVRNSNATDEGITMIEKEILNIETYFTDLLKGTEAAPTTQDALQPQGVDEIEEAIALLTLQNSLLTN